MGKRVRHGPNRRGFTLVELLVTVVIIGILAAISLKMVNVRDRAYEAQMVSDLRNLVSAQGSILRDLHRNREARSVRSSQEEWGN